MLIVGGWERGFLSHIYSPKVPERCTRHCLLDTTNPLQQRTKAINEIGVAFLNG